MCIRDRQKQGQRDAEHDSDADDELLRLCRFLIDCLNERGYLDCPLAELSREFDIPLFSLEQALFAVQMLDPPGVGARNLSECLTLQLAQGRSLDPLALKIDFVKRPPYFDVSTTHRAKTWLLDPRAPKIEPPAAVRMLQEEGK